MTMHWFDSMAKAAAGESALDRRGLFKGAAATAVLTSPLFGEKAVAAAGRIEARAAQMKCENCLKDEIKDLKKTLKNCDKSGNIFGIIPKGKKKGKRPAKARPIPAAEKIACVMKANQIYTFFTNECKKDECRTPQGRTNPLAPPGDAQAACPPNTVFCAGTLCCYGGDACCPCQNDWICCAGVIGCTCCG